MDIVVLMYIILIQIDYPGGEYKLKIEDILYCYSHLFYINTLKNIHDKTNNQYEDEQIKINCVISVPSFYSAREINLFYDIFKRNGFNEVYVICENLSNSLCFGYENNSKFFGNDMRLMLIIDIGYINTSFSLNKYTEVLNNIFRIVLKKNYIKQ